MNDEDDIPVLDDLIERGIEITLSDLGLDDDPPLRVADVLAAELEIDYNDAAPLVEESPQDEPPLDTPYPAYARATEIPPARPLATEIPPANPRATEFPPARTLADNPALEQAVRRILDEHMELAWQEIRLAIQQHLDRS